MFKVLIVGAGQVARRLHIPAFQQCNNVQVVGVCDVDLERAQDIACTYSIPEAYASLEEGLKDSGATIVSICTPPQTHHVLAMYALEHGSHVLIENPFTVTTAEAAEVLATAQRTGYKLSVMLQSQATPGVSMMREYIRRGVTGPIRHLDILYISNGHQDRMTANPDFWCHTLPGGRWTEVLPHLLSIAYVMVGSMELRCVAAQKRVEDWPWLLADDVQLVLESLEGYVTLHVCAASEDRTRRIAFLNGTRASYLVDYEAAMPLTKMAETGGSIPSISSMLWHEEALVKSGNVPSCAPWQYHAHMIDHFLQYVRDEASAPVSHEETYHIVALTEQIGQVLEQLRVLMSNAQPSLSRVNERSLHWLSPEGNILCQ